MLTLIIICALFGVFGIGGVIFAVVGGLLKFSLKMLFFSITLFLLLLCGIPLLLAGLVFGGLVFLF